ncbi:tetratricopeptide repeat protein [Methylophaga thiooxydans]|uniref:tetratricopeptide repeat protein n=1 Tax=Methylophaga thiooxydans TaxID=392484 RepID=UPI002356D752|nr:tetratricopeptide repeat protein [Methylophaga thiooxydans]
MRLKSYILVALFGLSINQLNAEELISYKDFHQTATPVPSLGELLLNFDESAYPKAVDQYEAAHEITDRSVRPTNKNYVMAMRLYDSSARNSFIPSMHNLAVLYANDPFKPDYDASTAWYRNAAKMGFAGSQNNYANAIEEHHGTQKTLSDAVYWYTQAAMQGEPTAYLSLGKMFLEGRGVQTDPSEAAFWLELAVAFLPDGLNLVEAKKKRQLALDDLNKLQMIEVEYRVRRFEPLSETPAKLSDRPS